MGEVYLADDPVLARKVALKLLPKELASDEEQRKRAIKEAERASHFSDPHVAQVLDVLQENHQVILVLEYVEGEILRKLIGRGIPLEDFWDLAIQCVQAVESAHREGFLHRDIKPENIMITPSGHVKILDFGIAKRLPRPDELAFMTTQTYTPHGVAGTPQYMSPEAHLNEALDARSDLFSLGVVFYEMLVRNRPFRGNLVEIIEGILHGEPEPPSSIDPRIPSSLDHVVMKLLSRDPGRRYGSAGELLVEFVAAQRGELNVPTQSLEPTDSQPSVTGLSSQPRATRWRWALMSFLLVLVAVSVIVPDVQLRWKRLLGMSLLPNGVSAAVLPFEAAEGDADLAAFSMGLNQVVNERLNQLGTAHGFFVVPMSDVQQYEVTSPDQARAELGVTLALRTSIQLAGTKLTAILELDDVKRRRTLDRAVVPGTWSDPAGFAGTLFLRAAQLLEMETDTRAEPLVPRKTEASAYRYYLEGLGTLATATDSSSMATAMAGFDRAISINPEFAIARAALAQAQLGMFEETRDATWLEEATSTAHEALGLTERLPTAHYVEGRILSEEQRWEEAVQEFDTVIGESPTHRNAYRGLATAYEHLGLLDNAEDVYESMVAALPDDPHCYWYLGYFYHQQGQDAKAFETFRKMTEVAPDLSRGHAYYGAYLVQLGQYSAAVGACERSIQLKPLDSAYTNLGTAYFQLRDFDEAIRTYREAMGFGYDNYRMWYNLAEAYYWAPGKRDLAAEPYTRAVELARQDIAHHPDDFQAMAEAADAFPKLGQPDSARVYIERSLEKSPDHPYVQYWAALVAWQLGARDEALDWLERAVANGYSSVWLRDSPIFDDWRDLPRFQAILEDT